MNKKIIIAALLATAGSSVMAQSAFQGFYGQIATGYESNTVSSLNGSETAPGYVDSYSASSQTYGGAPIVLGMGYNFSVAPNWLIGVGVDYSVLSQTSSGYSETMTSSGSGTPIGTNALGSKIKTSNRFNIFITPGYEIDKYKLVYFKAGYSSLNVQSQSSTTFQEPGGVVQSIPSPTPNTSKTVGGYVLGLGYKQIISGGLYGFAEGNYMSYSHANLGTTYVSATGDTTTSSLNPSVNSYQLLVGIGYKF